MFMKGMAEVGPGTLHLALFLEFGELPIFVGIAMCVHRYLRKLGKSRDYVLQQFLKE